MKILHTVVVSCDLNVNECIKHLFPKFMSQTRENSESSLKTGNPVPRQSLKVTVVHLRSSSWQSDESVSHY